MPAGITFEDSGNTGIIEQDARKEFYDMPRYISQTAPVLNRRELSLGAMIASAAFAFPTFRSAASAKQETDLTSLGLPSLDISLSTNGYEGIPESTPAGRYLVNLAIGDDVDVGAVGFVQPPAGMTAADFLAAVGLGQGEQPPRLLRSPKERRTFRCQALSIRQYLQVASMGRQERQRRRCLIWERENGSPQVMNRMRRRRRSFST